MILKKIEIMNFRSYYGSNVFELGGGLNLIIGSNGDGKTNFFDALNWLFKTDVDSYEQSSISKKRIFELDADKADTLKVAITYEHDGVTKCLEKSFRFRKNDDDTISTSEYSFHLITSGENGREPKDGRYFDFDLPAELRRYSMFKGETDLDVFHTNDALRQLIDIFSEVRNFDAYDTFMHYATEQASQYAQKEQSKDTRNKSKIQSLHQQISDLKQKIGELDRRIKKTNDDADNYEKLLANLVDSQETAESIKNINARINSLMEKRNRVEARINDNYSIRLLDDMWVLLGYSPIADEFSSKVGALNKKKRELQSEYDQQLGAKKAIHNIVTGNFTQLPVNVPGRQILQEMLEEHVCKFCGRPAEEGSDAWNFIQNRLNEFNKSVSPEEKEEPSIFTNRYIEELSNEESILNNNLSTVNSYRKNITGEVNFNNQRRQEIESINKAIKDDEQKKNNILAQSNAESEEKMLSNFENLLKWNNGRDAASKDIIKYNQEKTELESELQEAQDKLTKLSEGTNASLATKIDLIIHDIAKAFSVTKENNKTILLTEIEELANGYMEKLNIDDFHGTIRIRETVKLGKAAIRLLDKDDSTIANPNTALKTTMYMAVLFAIADISSKKKEKRYPLIFDAPTSSFTLAKEKEFFNVIGKIDKQIVIVTKSFLKGDGALDYDTLQTINGNVLRIAKKEPFNDKDQATIQTVVSKIK